MLNLSRFSLLLRQLSLALALVCLPASGWAGSMTLLGVDGGAASTPFSITQLASPVTTTTNATDPASISGVAVASSGLSVYTICHGPNNTTITAVSIGSTSMSQATGAGHTSSAGSNCDIWYASGATGPTATLSITFSGGIVQTRIVVGQYQITGSPTPSFSAGGGNNTSSGTSLSAAVSIPSGGGAIAAALTHSATSGSGTPTNLSLDTNNLVVGTSTSYIGNNTTSSGSTTMGVSWTGSTDAALAIATFSP